VRTLEKRSSTSLPRLEPGRGNSCYIGVRFVANHDDRMYLSDDPNEFNNPFHGVPGAIWAERARDLAMQEIANPSLSTMMVCDLLYKINSRC
jgi:hypothetical protein